MAVTWIPTLVAVTPSTAGPPTFSEVCKISATNLIVVDELGGPGQATMDVGVDSLPNDAKARLRDLKATPCEIWIYRSVTTTNSAGTVATTVRLAFAGPLTGCALEGRTLTLTAPGLLGYLWYWLRDTAYVAAGVDQATIVQQLCDQWQAQQYANDGIITTGIGLSGVLRNLTLAATDGKFIGPVVTELGANANGYDLSVDPTTRALTLWSPRRGNDLTNSVFIDARSIGAPKMSWTVAAGTVGSEVLATASSSTGVTLSSIQSNPTLRASFGKAYVLRTFTDIADQAALDAAALKAVNDLGSQVFTIAPTLLPVAGCSYGDFAVGDLVSYSFDGGLGLQSFILRVASIQTTPTSGTEVLKVGFL